MERYFKKPNGIVIKYENNHDINSLKDRFEECDIDGKPLKKSVKKSTKKKGDK